MKVLITGANGLLAANAIRELNGRSIPVKGMLRKNSNRLGLTEHQYEEFEGSFLDYEDLKTAAKDCTVMIHIAACTDQNANWETYEKVNIKGTQIALNVAVDLKLDRFIFVSTANTVGNGTLMHPGTEKKPFMEWLSKQGYASSKRIAENLVFEHIKKKQLNAIVVNPTFIVGAYDAKPSSGKLIQYICNHRLLFYPMGGKNFVNAKDAAIAIVNAINIDKKGEKYLLAGDNLSYKQFYKMVVKQVGKKALLIPIPKSLLLISAYLNKKMHSLLSKHTAFTPTSAKMLNCTNYYSGKKANQELMLPKNSITKGINEAIQWFKKYGYLHTTT